MTLRFANTLSSLPRPKLQGQQAEDTSGEDGRDCIAALIRRQLGLVERVWHRGPPVWMRPQRPPLGGRLAVWLESIPLYCINTPPEFETSDWGAVVTGLLTQRGLFTRDLESFGAVVWGPIGNPTFTTGPQALSLEPENARGVAERVRMSLSVTDYEETPRTLALGVLR